MEGVLDNLRVLGPVLVIVWGLTLGFTLLRPQRFFNSMLLLFSLLMTLLFVAGFFDRDTGAWILLFSFLALLFALFLVPILLIVNGVQLLRREGFAPAHVLSLALGIIVGVGELAMLLYVFALSGKNYSKLSVGVLFVGESVFYFSFLVLSFVVNSVFIQIMPHRMNFQYIIIHGCGLADGERMTKLLSNRVDKAIELYEKCAVKPVIIPSGGQGADEKISEAQAMKDYLLVRGVPEEHIVLEDLSATTRENLLNSKAIIDARGGAKRVALVSSNYHIYRCVLLARKVGLKCTGIGAKVALYYWPSALIREFIAVFVTPRFLILSLLSYLLFMSPLLYSLLR